MAALAPSSQLISVDLQQDTQGEVKVTEVEIPAYSFHDVEHLVESQIARLRQELQLEFGDLRTRLDEAEQQLAELDGFSVHRRSSHGSLTDETPSAAPNMTNENENEKPSTTEVPVVEAQKGEEEEEVTEVRFEESIWTVPLLLGLAELPLGWFDSLFAALLVVLNVTMQTCFSAILLTRAFMGDAFEAKVGAAEVWRTSVAHDFKHLDLADTSLVSRVCMGDEALILSTTQAALIDQINSFLGLEKTQYVHGTFQPGILLSMLCIVLWTLCVYKEFRLIWRQAEIAISIPTSSSGRTSLKKNRFRSLSRARRAMLVLIHLARAGIASILLVAGILWLARTTSIQDLMLNAVALNAILDVDEFLFVGMTPAKIQEALGKLKPTKVYYSNFRSQVESTVHFGSLLTVVLLSYFFLLDPLQQIMLTVKTQMCDGNQTFVVSHNTDTQRTIGLVTVMSRDLRNDSISEIAVRAHKATSAETTPDGFSTYITFAPDIDTFSERRSRTMREEASAYPFCVETRLLNSSGDMYGDASMQPLATQLVNTAAATVGRTGATSCLELKDQCSRLNARLLRLVCGQTCGCTDPYSSPWYRTETQGCASTCLRIARRALSSSSCTDVSVTSDGWQAFWSLYPVVARAYFGEGAQANLEVVVAQTVERMLSAGCEALIEFPTDAIMDVEWCEGMPDLFRPLAHLCPQSCGCTASSGGALPSFCPASCNLSL
ncbi:unnamed protein product [Symbiodinium sp. CCMP2592]|nr:unnamed protein product [Symbiodinium sp. CCMP2592]